MFSKLILLNETISVPRELRNLSGHEFSLQDFPTHDYDESVRLYSLHFSEIEDLEEIWNKANTLIALINGGLNLYLRNQETTTNITANCITDELVTRRFHFPTGNRRFAWTYPFNRVELERNLRDSNFVPTNHFLNTIINLSSINNDAFELLLLNSLDRNLTNLYKLYETVEFYFKDQLDCRLANGLSEYEIFQTQIRSFKQTANHGNYDIFQLISNDVRHGRNQNPNEFQKMELEEAIKFVQKVVFTYFTIKYNI